MALHRYVNTALWEDRYVRQMKPDQKLLWLYLICNPRCTISGVYELTADTIRHHTGLSLKAISTLMARFAIDGRLTYHEDWVILTNAPKHQYWRTSQNVRKGIENDLLTAPPWVLSGIRDGTIPYAYPLDRVPTPLVYPMATPPNPCASYPYPYPYPNSMKSYPNGAAVDKVLTGIAEKIGTGPPKGKRS